MKTLFLFVSILCASSALFSQNLTLIKKVHEKTDSNTYVVEYFSHGRKFYSNANNPFEGLEDGYWPDGIRKITVMGERPDSIAMEVLNPYHTKRKEDISSVYIAANYDLKGEMRFLVIGLPANVDIPIQVFEELENRVKKESHLKLDYDPKRAKGINYIQLVWMY
ncbi:hypothetical protein [Bacteroides bouchesdurhonensis]|uniref:hypothetical protein n=1 Tax=Bacteroides bouchesdurhonensis TaxID=1841855 RepID=UPI00097F8832|nr:hypothetical protein [Bacteroides bouchesdurhonensis]